MEKWTMELIIQGFIGKHEKIGFRSSGFNTAKVCLTYTFRGEKMKNNPHRMATFRTILQRF